MKKVNWKQSKVNADADLELFFNSFTFFLQILRELVQSIKKV